MSARMVPVFIGALAFATACGAAGREPATIGQLESREASVDRSVAVEAAAGDAARSYEDFLRILGTDPVLRAQALRRLGDLRLEESESLKAVEGAASAGSVDAARQAVAAYRQLLQEQPRVAGADAVLYQLARAYDALGDDSAARASLDEYVRRFPQGAHYGEVQFRRGEAFFAEGRYAEAEHAYAAVQSLGPASEFYEQAVYKRGWSFFKQSRDEESTMAFLDLLDHVLVREGRVRRDADLTRPEQELTGDALRALAITFAASDGPDSLRTALGTRGTVPYEARLYTALGDLYIEKERYQDAAQAYRAFASRSPMDTEAPLLLVKATAAYERGGFMGLVLDSRRELVERFGPETSYWRTHEQDLDPTLVAAVQEDLLDLARHHHALAQKGSAEDRDEAVRWYRAYLAGFDHEPGAPATRMLLADLQFDGGRYADAAEDYERTAYSYPNYGEAGRAGYAALVAWDKAATVPSARDAMEARGIDSSLRFATTFPDHPETPAVLTRTAKTLFDRGDSVRAAGAARQVLAFNARATDEQQRVAWTVLAHTAFDDGRYAEAEQAYSELARRLPSEDPQLAEIKDRLAASVYRQGEQRQQAGDATGAVQDYLRVASVAPGTAAAVKGQYDAATLLIAAKDWQQAATVLERLRVAYPDDSLQPEVTRKLAAVYQEAGRDREAAGEFERIADSNGEDADVRRAAQWRAAELYSEVHDAAGARRAYEGYVERFPVPVGPAIEARQELATLAGAAGDTTARQRWLAEIIAADAAAGAARTDRSRYLAAGAALELARPLDAGARAIPLTVPLDRSLARRKAATESALGAWSRAADYGVAGVTTEATYAMADLYRDFGSVLLASERPPGLSADEREQYDLLLEEQAYPFEEKAIAIHEVNARRAASGTWDEWVRRSYTALAVMKPARYSRSELLDAADAVPGTPPEAVQSLTAARTALESDDAAMALERVDAALEIDPTNAVAHNMRAVALRRLGRFADARASYDAAITQAPAYAPAERNLAVLLDLYLGEAEAALPHYQRYQELTEGADAQTGSWLVELRARLGQVERTAEAKP